MFFSLIKQLFSLTHQGPDFMNLSHGSGDSSTIDGSTTDLKSVDSGFVHALKKYLNRG